MANDKQFYLQQLMSNGFTPRGRFWTQKIWQCKRYNTVKGKGKFEGYQLLQTIPGKKYPQVTHRISASWYSLQDLVPQ